MLFGRDRAFALSVSACVAFGFASTPALSVEKFLGTVKITTDDGDKFRFKVFSDTAPGVSNTITRLDNLTYDVGAGVKSAQSVSLLAAGSQIGGAPALTDNLLLNANALLPAQLDPIVTLGGLALDFVPAAGDMVNYHPYQLYYEGGQYKGCFPHECVLVTVQAVPEPGQWIMLLSGFAVVGLTVRWRWPRRQRQQAA